MGAHGEGDEKERDLLRSGGRTKDPVITEVESLPFTIELGKGNRSGSDKPNRHLDCYVLPFLVKPTNFYPMFLGH